MTAQPVPSLGLHPSILREYDIRGVVGQTLGEQDAYLIGRAFASLPKIQSSKRRICVGMDGRLTSPTLAEALCKGLQDSGAQVLKTGLGPTPMLYFSVHQLKTDGGIMITGSHNPPTHNGFKLMLGTSPFFGEQIKALGIAANEKHFVSGKGTAENVVVKEEYLAALLGAYRGKRGLRVAWDAGNGAAGEIMQALCKRLPGEHFTLFAKIDGNFPNHHPDPTKPENLATLIATVKKERCDLGIAFDGDGDRIGVVDGEGTILWGDQLLAILAVPVLREHPGATIIADIKASSVVFDTIKKLGGKPLMWKAGHSHIKAKLAETKAKLAGEMSGHLFFADRYFGFDDALYAAVRLLDLLAEEKISLTELRRALPATTSTPEVRFACEDERKFTVIEEIKARLARTGVEVSAIDGVRVQGKSGWWLLRASNTEPVLVARCEAKDEAGLAALKKELATQLATSGVSVPAALS